MTDHTDFDAADLADSILGLDESTPEPDAVPDRTKPDLVAPAKRSAIGWVLLVGLIIAVSVAISLAVQLDRTDSPRVTPPCGGLYSDCCDEWDDNWGPCGNECDIDTDDRFDDRGDGKGLFDAEEDFVERRLPAGC